MRAKTSLIPKAIELRHRGYSYSEIATKVPVSKSTLSLWIRTIVLNKNQRQRLLEKMTANRLLGSRALKQQRVEKTRLIVASAKAEIEKFKITKRDLFLIGTILYWAEGSKQKEHNPSQPVVFSNSDPKVIQIFLKWLTVCLQIPNRRIVFEIYIHESYQKSPNPLQAYWARLTGFPTSKFGTIRYKKNKITSYRKNRGENYYGVLRVKVGQSTDLNRKISGWIEGIVDYCGIV